MTRELHGFDVDYELIRFVRRTREHAMGRLHEIHEELDYNTFLLFAGICDAPDGVRASGLSERLRVHKSTVSRGVATLERLGLIERSTDPDDARAQQLSVSPEALRRFEAYRRRTYDWLGRLLTDWSEQDVQTFARQLARLNEAAESTPDILTTTASS